MNKLMNNCIQNSTCHTTVGNTGLLTYVPSGLSATNEFREHTEAFLSVSIGFNQQSYPTPGGAQ